MKIYKIQTIILISITMLLSTTAIFAKEKAVKEPKHKNISIAALVNPFKLGERKTVDIKSTDNKNNNTNQTVKSPAVKDSNINLNISDKDKHSIKISDPIKNVEDRPLSSDDEKMQQAFQIQKKMDINDITMLWEGTVARNTVIKFALKKLAMPAEQRRVHSSIMARSVSTLISGAAILPNIFGADSITSTATLAGGSLANRVIHNKTMPKEMPLTDSELIQLAQLIETLQDRLIKNYYDYKSSVEALRVCRQNLLLQNKNYSEAIKSGQEIPIIASSSLYDKELLNEMTLKQQIKLSRLELERLAGPEIINKLSLNKLESLSVKEPEPGSSLTNNFQAKEEFSIVNKEAQNE